MGATDTVVSLCNGTVEKAFLLNVFAMSAFLEESQRSQAVIQKTNYETSYPISSAMR